MSVPVEYEQTDPRWRNHIYSNHNDPRQTIGSDGCGPTCAAMVIATLKNKSVTPIQTANWSMNHGFVSDNDGTYWGFFRACLAWYGIDSKQVNTRAAGGIDQVITALKKDRMVITAMGKGHWTTCGHFILAYGIKDNKVLIHDPNSEASYREKGEINYYKAEAAQAWIVPEVWNMEIKNLGIKDLDRNKTLTVQAVNIDDTNYVKLRDLEKLAPITIGYDGVPTIKANYK